MPVCVCCAKLLQLCQTLFDPTDHARLFCPWDSLGKNTTVGSHALLQVIFPTQGSNPRHLLMFSAWQVGSLPLLPPGKSRLNDYQFKIQNNYPCEKPGLEFCSPGHMQYEQGQKFTHRGGAIAVMFEKHIMHDMGVMSSQTIYLYLAFRTNVASQL